MVFHMPQVLFSTRIAPGLGDELMLAADENGHDDHSENEAQDEGKQNLCVDGHNCYTSFYLDVWLGGRTTKPCRLVLKRR